MIGANTSAALGLLAGGAFFRFAPAFRQSGIFELGLVAASTDPVAIDLWAWREIESERAKRGLPTLEAAGRPVRFLATAAKHGLGVDDPEKLLLVTA